jgi:transmembrane sensor
MKRSSRDEQPIDWAATTGAVDDVIASLDAKVRRRRAQRRRRLLAGGTLGLVLIAGVARFAPGVLADKNPIAAASFSSATTATTTLVSHPEQQVLSDGSVVELKPGARIRVAFTAARRRVVLEEGEAHFQVAKNPQRPFVVVAGAVQFRAVGTAFSVQRGQREVELFVTEGRVAVDQPAASPSSNATTSITSDGASTSTPAAETEISVVEAGHRVVVTADSTADAAHPLQVVAVPADQALQRLAWRVPTLEFSGTPLSEALPLFERHGKIRLILADPELAQVRLSGLIRADNIDTLLALLEESHGIQAEKRGDSEIVLHKRR